MKRARFVTSIEGVDAASRALSAVHVFEEQPGLTRKGGWSLDSKVMPSTKHLAAILTEHPAKIDAYAEYERGDSDGSTVHVTKPEVRLEAVRLPGLEGGLALDVQITLRPTDFLETANQWDELDVENCWNEGLTFYRACVDLARRMFLASKGLHGWAAIDCGPAATIEPDGIDVHNRNVRTICKMNLFSAETLKPIGRERLLNVPSWLLGLAERTGNRFASWSATEIEMGGILLYEDSSPLVIDWRSPFRQIEEFLGMRLGPSS